MASGAEGKAFFAEYASQGRAKCKNCKEQIAKTSPRIGKVVNNPFSDDGGTMKQWYHVTCIFDSLTRARATTKKIESTDDLEGFDSLKEEEKSKIRGLIKDFASKSSSPSKKVKKPVQIKLPFGNIKASSTASTSTAATKGAISATAPPSASKSGNGKDNRDNSFREFRRLCIQLSEEPGYNAKTKIIANFFKKGFSGEGFTGDLFLWVKMLLPGVNKRVYNLQSKQLIKLFSQIFSCSQEAMLTDLEQGDVSDTISKFFQENKVCKPLKKSTLTLPEVDALLEKMSKVTRDDDQQRQLANAAKRCTTNDLRFLVRLIKHDLRMNTGAKHVLEALDPDAYQAFQASNNLRDVVERCAKTKSASVPGISKKLSIRASVMTPVKPMLAEACKSFSHAIKKCPKGMYAEIKYDGERVQLHKSGNQFEFYSRSLKPVLPHKVAAIKEYLSKACPHANDLILDSEVLLVDKTTGNPLPFGTLGIHKKSAFKDASVCLFVFDCLQFNDENLMKKCMKERREILEKNVTVIPNRIMLSEMNFVTTEKELSVLMARAIKEGLEGLVLKDVNGIYEPGKRHWLKMKKDYLAEGAMADTADLVALGAYYGTGNKGGLMSIFLMGVYDTDSSKWRTVAKCGNGHDDKTIERLSKELPMKKIGKDPAKVPSWLDVHRSLVPDFVIKDPKKAPVWEITGAEFSKSSTHTADGISIRFPRVTRIRDDKNWETATDLAHLKTLFKNSRASTDVSELLKPAGGDDNDENEEETEVMETEKDDHKDDEKKNTAGNTQAGKKRKMEKPVDIGGTPKKKAKPSCKYGSKCYQKNPEHFRTYSHPEEDTGDEKSKRKSQDLPNIFTGLKIFLHDSVKDLKKLKRYVIAYDGDIIADYEMSSATHVISDSKISGDGAAKVVKSDWLRQCVKKQQLLAEEKFKFP